MELLVVAVENKTVKLEWDTGHFLNFPRVWFPDELRVGDVLKFSSDRQGLVQFEVLEYSESPRWEGK